MSDPYLALKVVMMPKDTNGMPTVLPGGVPIPLHLTMCQGSLYGLMQHKAALPGVLTGFGLAAMIVEGHHHEGHHLRQIQYRSTE